jgi:enediyne biosynthesis protein E4
MVFLCLGTSADWVEGPGHRRAPLADAGTNAVGFLALPPDITGITFTNWLAQQRALTNQIYLNGSGVAAGDVDGDGRADLYFCGLDSDNRLYLNRGGWRFEDATAAAGVACPQQASTGAALTDLDGDGDLDLLVNAVDRATRLFLNDGRAHFRDATETSGLGGPAGSMSMALADVDGDGDLDLYVVNYRITTMRDEPEKRFRVGVTNGVYQLLAVDDRPASASGVLGRFTVDPVSGVTENGEPDALFLNDGGAHFTRVDWARGAFLDEGGRPAAVPYDWGLSAMFYDVNRDGAPDLYVCNDFQSPDRFWLNDGHGQFHALPHSAIRQTSLFSMGVDFADVDRDGFVDVFVADMLSREHVRRQVQVMNTSSGRPVEDRPQYSRNTLLRNRGDGTFAEMARLAGVEASEWSWCPVFLDVDLDGFEDLLITTGHGRDAQNADVAALLGDTRRQQRMSFSERLQLRRQFPVLHTPNVAFRNRGDLTFEDMGPAWGFDSTRISQGMALADLDGDGDLDVAVNCLNDGPLIYRNAASAPRVAVRLRGRPPNTHGIGARISVMVPGQPRQEQEVISGGRYLSSDEAIRTFAAGSPSQRLTLEVVWRNGSRSIFRDLPANQIVEVEEAMVGPVPTPPVVASPGPWFADLSAQLRHQHVDEPFDDFARQPLLPRTLSQLGPGITWFDFNSDGWDDLLVGAGRGGRLAVFRNDTRGGFVSQRSVLLQQPAENDLTTVLGWRPAPESAVLLLGMANYESGRTQGAGLRQINLNTGSVDDLPAVDGGSVGPLALGDLDGDGAPELFVGGRVLPGRYPLAPESVVLRSQSGRFERDRGLSAGLSGAGMVSSAVLSDLTGEGRSALILACEWGPLRIFRWNQGLLSPWNPPIEIPASPRPGSVPLSELTGIWNSVTSGDFDNDGRLDLVAGNWGRNTGQQRYLSSPLKLYFGEANPGGSMELIEAHRDSERGELVPERDLGRLSAAFPVLRDRFTSFTAFSTANLAEILASGDGPDPRFDALPEPGRPLRGPGSAAGGAAIACLWVGRRGLGR